MEYVISVILNHNATFSLLADAYNHFFVLVEYNNALTSSSCIEWLRLPYNNKKSMNHHLCLEMSMPSIRTYDKNQIHVH